jgi:hypothetical protein
MDLNVELQKAHCTLREYSLYIGKLKRTERNNSSRENYSFSSNSNKLRTIKYKVPSKILISDTNIEIHRVNNFGLKMNH